MQTVENNPARARSRFWRVMFWFTLIHLILAGIIAVGTCFGMGSDWRYETFHLRDLGLIKGISLWMFLNMPLIWCALAAADVLVLWFIRRWARGMPNARRFVVFFLAAVLCLAALNGAGGSYAAWVGTLNTSNNSYDIGRRNIAPVIIIDVMFVLPALLVLARLMVRGWPSRAPGLCVSCGYDLTGNTSGRCPECGTPLA